MPRTPRLSRREFSVKAALAMLSSVPITLSGCSDTSSPSRPSPPPPTGSTPPPTPPTAPSGVSGNVGSNHGHTAFISDAQLGSNETIMLDITGDSDHPHTVEVTAAELAMIGDGERVSKESSVDAAHSHTVTFN